MHPRLPLDSVEAPHRSLTVEGLGDVTLYEEDACAGDPLLLLHSMRIGASSFEMRRVFETFRTQRPVTALDLPGFGTSHASRSLSRDDFTAAVVACVRDVAARHGRAVDVTAAGITAEVAARAAVEEPTAIRSLTLLSPSGLSTSVEWERFRAAARSGKIRRRRRLLESYVVGAPLFAGLRTRPGLRWLLSGWFANGEVEEDFLHHAVFSTREPQAWRAAMALLSGDLLDPDVAASYAELRLPVHVMFDPDAVTEFGRLPHLAQKNAWMLTPVTGTRIPHVERPGTTYVAMRTFFDRTGAEFATPPQRSAPVSRRILGERRGGGAPRPHA